MNPSDRFNGTLLTDNKSTQNHAAQNMGLNAKGKFQVQSILEDYQPLSDTFDEYMDAKHQYRSSVKPLMLTVNELSKPDLIALNEKAKQSVMLRGITFKVYSQEGTSEDYFPFNLLPRIVNAQEWEKVEKGIQQRMQALNTFLQDAYSHQKIFKDKKIPWHFLKQCPGYLPQLQGIRPKAGVHMHICGFDLIRHADGVLHILEDNLRVPSGVSYLLENRKTMEEIVPQWIDDLPIQKVDNYPQKLLLSLQSFAKDMDMPMVVVLSPGSYNSAWFEHQYLAEKMGCPLVFPNELSVEKGFVYWHSKQGKHKVDVIYRRIDDQYMDPSCLRTDSLLGVPGIVDVWRKGHIVLANALGNGLADDKAIYYFVPEMIRYYLGENIILPQVKTFLGTHADDYEYMLAHLEELVVKKVDQSGGHGMLIGPQASQKELELFRQKIQKEPHAYIAQPLIEFSTIPAYNHGISPHRSDLRIFSLQGAQDAWVLPGGLTRVALREGSYVVNSSQGGGAKDTWILRHD